MNDIEQILKPKNKTLKMSQGERVNLINLNRTSYFSVGDFSFLKDHKSLRPGKKHLLLGTPGSGKSTLARSICNEVAKNHKVMWYSSEEDLDDTKTAASFAEQDDLCLDNIFFREEDAYVKKHKGDHMAFLMDLFRDFTESQCEVLFFDNLTTSSFYEGKKLDEQKDFFNLMSSFFKEVKKPVFIIAHTDSKTKDLQKELFDANSIRGQKLPSNKCEYIYAYQIISWSDKDEKGCYVDLNTSDKKSAFVRVLKSRAHPNGGVVYALNYNPDKRAYGHDRKIDFEKFSEVYKKRIKLQ
jgi:adenylate kinase family enzyme